MAEYRVRSTKLLLQYIIPIFDQNSLLTSKYHNYELFKQAILIQTNPLLTNIQKHNMLTELKSKVMPINYISPAWSEVNNQVNVLSDATIVMSKAWVVGFTEAEGSFYLFTKDVARMAHAFEITQKLDRIALEAAALILGARVISKKTYNTLYVDSLRKIPDIINFYKDTMKGMKSLEYRIWARSFNAMTTGKARFEYLTKVQNQMRNIRSIRLDNAFNIVKRVSK